MGKAVVSDEEGGSIWLICSQSLQFSLGGMRPGFRSNLTFSRAFRAADEFLAGEGDREPLDEDDEVRGRDVDDDEEDEEEGTSFEFSLSFNLIK